jgi:nucleoside phosphorylase
LFVIIFLVTIMSIKIFVSYARKDEKLWELLEAPLSPLVDTNTIQLWSPHKNIVPGQNTKQEIDKHLKASQVFLLLLSADYIASAECMQQMRGAVARMQKEPEHVHVIPIILRPFVLQTLRSTGLEGLERLPRGKAPITSWPNRDDAITHVVGELYEIIDNIDKNDSDSGPGTPDLTSQSQANQYNLTAKTINAGIIGNNYGNIVNNNSGGAASKVSTPQITPTTGKQNEATDVGIIIALPEEFQVLFADIRTICTMVNDADARERYYTFEHASTVMKRPYRCVTTFIGNQGPAMAALQTQRMITRWNPTTLVLPGIAGSLNSTIRLGDIVIANQIDGYQESAMANPIPGQSGYTLAFSGEVYRASRGLLNAVQHFEFSAPNTFQAWQKSSQEALQQLALSPEQRAQLVNDKLLREQAQITEGHIASGSTVGAAPAYTAWLKTRDRKYLAIEMEALGFMTAVYQAANNIDTLVLRAISDLGDENKEKLDKVGDGLLRTYAMRNAVQLLWSFLDAGLLLQKV